MAHLLRFEEGAFYRIQTAACSSYPRKRVSRHLLTNLDSCVRRNDSENVKPQVGLTYRLTLVYDFFTRIAATRRSGVTGSSSIRTPVAS